MSALYDRNGKGLIQKNAHLYVEKEKLSVTNFALEDFELVFFTVQSAKNRGGGGIKKFQMEAEPKMKVIT